MKVCVIGLGYIGLPTALLLAKGGHEVEGYDLIKEKIAILNKGELPFQEKGLPELFAEAKKKFKATSTLAKNYDAFIICVPTPHTKQNTCDLEYVESAIRSIIPALKKNAIVILESTVAPGTTTNVVKPILEQTGLKAGKDFQLACVCEKAIPGNTINEMINNARIIGGYDEASKQKAQEVYKVFVKGEIILTDCTTSETVKLVENTYRDINIAFANDLAKICAKLGINVWDVIKYANMHSRVNVHQPGPGVGGHCIAIDPWFLVEKYPSELVKAARIINNSMPKHVFTFLQKIAKGKPTIGILGVAYKKNVDDSRETPALELISLIKEKSWNVVIHDPLVKRFEYPLEELDKVLKADIVAIVTDHDEYKKIDFSKVKTIIDTRNMGIPNSHLLGRDF